MLPCSRCFITTIKRKLKHGEPLKKKKKMKKKIKSGEKSRKLLVQERHKKLKFHILQIRHEANTKAD